MQWVDQILNVILGHNFDFHLFLVTAVHPKDMNFFTFDPVNIFTDKLKDIELPHTFTSRLKRILDNLQYMQFWK